MAKLPRPISVPTNSTNKLWADRFEEEYPEEPVAQLGWLVEHLGLRGREGRLVLLLGLTGRGAGRLEWAPSLSWSRVSQKHPEQFQRVVDLLGEYLELFGYDWEKAADSLRPRMGESWPPDEALPSLRTLPGTLTIDEKLLAILFTGGPEFLPAFIRFFTRDVGSNGLAARQRTTDAR